MEVPQHSALPPKKSEKKTMEVETIKKTEAPAGPKEALLFGDEDIDKVLGMIAERDEKAEAENAKEIERSKMQSQILKNLPALENYLQVTESLIEVSNHEDVKKMLKDFDVMEEIARNIGRAVDPEYKQALRNALAKKTEEFKKHKEADAQYQEVKKTQDSLAPAWAEAKESMLFFYDRLPDRDQQALSALTLMSGDEDFAKKYAEKLPDADKKILEVAPDMKAELVKRRLGANLKNERIKMKMQGEDPVEILQAMENIAMGKQEFAEAQKAGDEKKMKLIANKIQLNQGILGATGIAFTEEMNDIKAIQNARKGLENGQLASARGLMAMTANSIPEENLAARAKVNAAKNNILHVAAEIKWQKYAKSQQAKQ